MAEKAEVARTGDSRAWRDLWRNRQCGRIGGGRTGDGGAMAEQQRRWWQKCVAGPDGDGVVGVRDGSEVGVDLL